MSEIIQTALDKYKPTKILLLFSGGHDSLCSTHNAATYLKSIGAEFCVYHGNTGIGIKETRRFVIDVCMEYGYNLVVRKPPAKYSYENYVSRFGFPGPSHHFIMYRRLKERALKKHIQSLKVKFADKILLITGVRKSESKIRMGYQDHTTKDGSAIWCNANFYWSDKDIANYMKVNSLPRNTVKDKICISGECLCGAFAGNEEWSEIKSEFPDAANEIERLHEIAIINGHPWRWSSGPAQYKRHNPKGQLSMFMCVGCEEKNLTI